MHNAAYLFVESVVRHELPQGLIVEFGGLNINGTVRPLFGKRYISIDRVSGEGVDEIADAATYTPPEPPSCVVCCEVLEHTADAPRIVARALKILTPGGLLILTAATTGRAPHSAVDGWALRPNEFYANVEESKLREWLAGFEQVRIVVNDDAHDIYATARKPSINRKAK